jgi:hypothetical protein
MLRAARCLAVFALGIAVSLLAPPASAMTTVSVDGTTVVIHVPIETIPVGIAGNPDAPLVDSGEIAKVAKQAEDIWNEALRGFKWDCLSFRLDVQLSFLHDRKSPHQAGWHRVEVRGVQGVSFWNATGSDDQNPTLDNPFPYQAVRPARISFPDSAEPSSSFTRNRNDAFLAVDRH